MAQYIDPPVQQDPIEPRTGRWTLPWLQFWAKVQTAYAGTVTAVTGVSPIASTGGTTPAISLNDTTVVPGSYRNTSVTFDSKGRATAASDGLMLTSDPASPANDTWWFFRDGGTPENLSLRVRRSGVTYDVPLFTFP